MPHRLESTAGQKDRLVSQRKSDIAAIEVFVAPAEVPLEFPADPLCGSILIWRKADHRRR
jgi:hypothetical protein